MVLVYPTFILLQVSYLVTPFNAAPSLHPHYRDFITTTSSPATVPDIDTLILEILPLVFLSLTFRRLLPVVPH